MKTIAIINQKGGVAKTTTTVNIAAILAAEHHKRVLVIDADSQANATAFLLRGEQPADVNLAKVLRYDSEATRLTAKEWVNMSIQDTALPGVDLIAGDESLMDLDLTKVELGAASATILRDFLRDPGAQKHWDYCLIDCPPAFNAAAVAALVAADEVIIPVKLDAFALQGMANLTRQISNMRKINPRLRLGGLLPVMWYGSDQIKEAERQLRLYDLPVYPHIRRSPKVDDMTFAQRPLIQSSPKSGACQDYRSLVRRLVKGGADRG